MAAGFAVIPLYVSVGEELPDIVIGILQLVAEGRVKSIAAKQADSQSHTSVTLSGWCRHGYGKQGHKGKQ